MSEPPLGRRVVVADTRLAIHQDGDGAPAVVWLPGAGLVGLDYLNVHRQVAERTTSVIYDRGGTGWSDPVPLPRTAAAAAEELRALLALAGVPGPYLLVGHSLGAACARRYAGLFPGEVAGLLLLDPFHEDLPLRVPEEVREKAAEMRKREIPEPGAAQLSAGREAAGRLLAAWPEEVRDPLVEQHVTAAWRTAMEESGNVDDEVAEELRRAPDLPEVPLILLTAVGGDPAQEALWESGTVQAINETKTRLHVDLAASVPGGEQRILEGAAHA